ncbi:hypothetical protein LGK95_20140 [Clostridium algoriphilum]|uniref:hypothetical protein n=1 Tax=Clostridium algoriphilum TaxID=198347 RepID=UPI001CF4CBC2|nr:hypothetical protein [Clostridium algoriphilum]MCB2295789.1 hypothetical protein [Clostridium algoriphilum]
MSKAKKLDLSMLELTKIAKAINENTKANRNKNKDDKISTDIFIRHFGIQRKDFSETIKDTNIKYNKSTFQYVSDDIESSSNKSDASDTLIKIIHSNKGNTKVAPAKYDESETTVVKSETIGINKAIIEFENMKSGLVEMLGWYKGQRDKENIIDIEIPIISINRDKLTEQAITRGFKIYPSVVAEFKEFSKRNSQYTMQDLMAMALIEYMKKYSNK